MVKVAAVVSVGIVLIGACRDRPAPEADKSISHAESSSAGPIKTPSLPAGCSEPVAVTREMPQYPPDALVAGRLAGSYVFKVLVASNGLSESVEGVQAANREWARSAGVAALQKWTWKPAICGGIPSPAEASVPIQVSLK